MVYSDSKYPNLDIFLRALEWKMLAYLMAIGIY
jgi:hypothetical protein